MLCAVDERGESPMRRTKRRARTKCVVCAGSLCLRVARTDTYRGAKEMLKDGRNAGGRKLIHACMRIENNMI